MNKGNQRRFGSILGYIYTICQAIISIIYIPILLHGIGDSEYGIYQMISSVMAYFAAMEAPFSASLLRYYSLYKEDGNQKKMENTLAIGRRVFMFFSVGILLISFVVAILFKNIYSASLSNNELSEALCMFCIMIINLIINMNGNPYVAAISANESFIFLKISSLITLIIQPVLVLVVIKEYPYAIVIVLITTLLSFVLFCVRRYFAKKKLRVVVKYHGYDSMLVKNIIRLSLSVLVVAIADQIFWKTDQLILGAMYNTKTVSIYSVGSQINSMFISMGCVIGGMTLPLVTKISKEKHSNELISKAFYRIGRYQSYFVFLILTGVVIFGKEFIIILAGPEYLETYLVALLLMIPYSIDLIQTCAGAILQVRNMYHVRSVVMILSAIVNIGITLALARINGMIGAATATAISIVAANVFLNIFYNRVLKLDVVLFWKQCIPIVVAAVCTSICGFLLLRINFNNQYFSFAVHVILYSLMYASIMYIFVMNNNERMQVKSIVGYLFK